MCFVGSDYEFEYFICMNLFDDVVYDVCWVVVVDGDVVECVYDWVVLFLE